MPDKKERRESPSGYHYYYLYTQCPYKWYLKYVQGIRPRFTAIPLIRGGIIHDAHEVYYNNNWSLEAGLKHIYSEFDRRLPEFEEKEKMPEVRDTSLRMFHAWHDAFHHDRDDEILVECEKQRTFKIGPNKDFDFTVRMDRVFRSLERRTLIIRDTKTTGYSIPKAFQTADAEDQMTAYLWAASRIWPEERSRIVEVDVLYTRGKKTEAQRCGPIYRTPYDLARFEVELYGLIQEVSSKYLSLETFPKELLFPRNGLTCALFSCEYAPVCRVRLEPGMVPIGYRSDPWVEENKLLTKAQRSFNIELITKGVTT